MKNCLIPLAAAAALAAAGGAAADDVGKKLTDPVTQKQVTVAKDTPFVAVNQTRVYFADAKSRETFLKTPETYLAKTKLECPVKGFPARPNKANRVVVNDQIVYLCCAGCPAEFTKEPNNFLGKITDPVSGKEFSLSADAPRVTFKGGTYYFESEANKAAFEKEPAKYARVVLP